MFTSNYHYLSCKYDLSHSDWYIDTRHLLGKVQLKYQQETKCCSSRITNKLCEIRDGLASCEKITDSNRKFCRFVFLNKSSYKKNIYIFAS